jgi:hypothetical protein
LGFALLLKFFQLEGHFPDHHRAVPKVAVEFLAEQLGLPSNAWQAFSFSDRTAKRIRAQIRDHLGFRPATSQDAKQLQQWLLQVVVSDDHDPEHLRRSVFDWCKSHKIEPPTKARIKRLVAAALHTFEETFFSGQVLTPKMATIHLQSKSRHG